MHPSHPHPANNQTPPPYLVVSHQRDSASPIMHRVIRTADQRLAGYTLWGMPVVREWLHVAQAQAFIERIAEDGESLNQNPASDPDDTITWTFGNRN